MNLSQIKKKYREILQESEDDSSNDELDASFEEAMHVIQAKHKRTQSLANKQNNTSIQKKQQTSLHTQIIQLKERLGQANQKIENKNTQLKTEHERKSEINQEKKVLEKHLQSYQEQLEKKDKQLIELKATRIGFESKLKDLEEQFLDKDLDREILKKQITFYQAEQKKFKELIKDKDDEIKLLTAKNKNSITLQNENERLKNDINRLLALLEDKKIFKTTKRFNQSYLGKSTCESQYWYNRDTISIAEAFLKKHQITEKGVLNNLTKLLQNTKKSTRNKSKSVSKRSRTRQRKNSTATYKDISVILPKHNASSKVCLGGSVYDSLLHSKSKMKSVFKDTIQEQQKLFNCRQIIRQYKISMDEMLQKNACSKTKLRKLTEWLMVSVDNLIKEEYVALE